MSQVDSKQVKRIFVTKLQEQTKKFDDRQFWADLRATHRAKFGPKDQELAAQGYTEHVCRLAASARITAFEAMVDQLGKAMHTDDINMILPVLRRAHVKYTGADVTIDGEVMEVFPSIAFELNVKTTKQLRAERVPTQDAEQEAKIEAVAQAELDQRSYLTATA